MALATEITTPQAIESSSIDDFPLSPIPAVNVATVPQRSPLRYPGGKTWLIPHIRHWLRFRRVRPDLLLEPFAGGGIVSLTSVMEGLTRRCLMCERDHDVAAFWHSALHHSQALRERVMAFHPTTESIGHLAESDVAGVVEHGFRTLVLNRTRRGGILAPGASLQRKGENGKGILSRWYPQTIDDRLAEIERHADKITFCETDGVQFLEAVSPAPDKAVVFVDPPYTAGGKQAGKRLYTHNEIDHGRLFELLADQGLDFMMTYDCAPEILRLVQKHRFCAVKVMMKNTHHNRLPELLVTPRPLFND